MACCCRGGKTEKASTICLGRCELPKHRCLEKEDVKPGPVPRHMGWLYTAKDSPDHQLRCGWRPGHISCSVLRRIEEHNGCKTYECGTCRSSCAKPCLPLPCSSRCLRLALPPPFTPSRSCSKTCIKPSCAMISACTSSVSFTAPGPLLRIIRHAGQYQLCTKPSDLCTSPSSPYALKYVLNPDEEDPKKAKYSIEAKFNDYHFDYTTSETSFILDFSPPNGCYKPC